MMDKQIHRDEFRLRIMATASCNKMCRNCLNDFQGKPKGLFINPMIVGRVIHDYMAIVKHSPIITFSGGEPGLHPALAGMLRMAHGSAILVTNGTALIPDVLKEIAEVHISIGERISQELLYAIRNYHGIVVFQHIVYEDTPYSILSTLCYKELYPIKFFQDFYAPPDFTLTFQTMMEQLESERPDVDIRYRFTGLQENRGLGCMGCPRRCITLKALWLFPDGTVSPCPQREELREYPEGDYMKKAFEFHRTW